MDRRTGDHTAPLNNPPRGDVAARFGPFALVTADGSLRLSRNGAHVPLQEQPLRLLDALLAAPGHVVTRDTLRNSLWPPGVHVDFEHGLNAAVRRLRRALGDTARTPRYVETLPRHGYRFLAPVERCGPAAPPRRLGVAVLPFRNLAPHADNGYFCDGITEDVITELSRVEALRVVSRTSVMQFRDGAYDLRQVARALRADLVVEGSVRRSGERVRIAVRLIDAHSEEQVWAAAYDRDVTDIFRIQRDVALQVLGAVIPDLPATTLAGIGRPGTSNVDAYRLYLLGRHCMFQFTEAGIRQGVDYFERSAALDPAYALPHAGLGFAYMILAGGHGEGSAPPGEALTLARRAIDRALALDPSLGQAHGVDACLKFMYAFDWAGAEEAFGRAIALGPATAETFDTYGLLCSALGRYDEALEAQRRAHDLDPLAPMIMSDIASTLLRAGRVEEALDQADALIRIAPAFPMGHSTRGFALVMSGRHDEGVRALQQAVRLSGGTIFLAQLAHAYAVVGLPDQAKEILARLEALSRERYVSPYHLAYVHAGLGDAERAIDALTEAVEQRSGGVYGLAGSFLFTSLRDHPRFTALLRRMNLPQQRPAPVK